MELVWNKSFLRILEKYIKRHPELKEKIKNKLELLTKDPHHPELRNHKLTGNLSELRAIVVEYDCRIVFRMLDESHALLEDIGSHDDVY
jgi:addiction module RelE/StbE family toxin